MDVFQRQLKASGARTWVVGALVALALVEILSLVFVEIRSDAVPGLSQSVESVGGDPRLRISEIRGSRIDDGAAMITGREPAPVAAPACFILPPVIWAYLLIAYGALLVFNFSSTFRRVTRPQWSWESAYTLLFVIGWAAWDGGRTAPWFPFAVVKFGLIIFALYAYLLEKRPLVKEREEKREEKTGSLF